MNRYRWIPIVAALVLAAVVGGIAYNAGLAHGIQQSGKIVMPAPGAYPYPYPYPYMWHPWGFGFPFAPFFFILFFILVFRCLFWRGRWHHAHCGYRPPSGDDHSDR
jgi:hypothetical protein